MLYGIPVKGTHAHAYVQSFVSVEDLDVRQSVASADGSRIVTAAMFLKRALCIRSKLLSSSDEMDKCDSGELAAFISYALSFPSAFLGLVDTYDTIASGVTNFMIVALLLHELGYQAVGIRLDSGDLALLSIRARERMVLLTRLYTQRVTDAATTAANDMCSRLIIMASNNLNERKLHELRLQKHEIDAFGIGTELVTCSTQPALGGVFKLAELGGKPRIKVSEDFVKTTIPGAKNAYRLYISDSALKEGDATKPIAIDLLTLAKEPAPRPGAGFHCIPMKSTFWTEVVPEAQSIRPVAVEPLLVTVYDGAISTSGDSSLASDCNLKILKGRASENIHRLKLGRMDGAMSHKGELLLSKALAELCIHLRRTAPKKDVCMTSSDPRAF